MIVGVTVILGVKVGVMVALGVKLEVMLGVGVGLKAIIGGGKAKWSGSDEDGSPAGGNELLA